MTKGLEGPGGITGEARGMAGRLSRGERYSSSVPTRCFDNNCWPKRIYERESRKLRERGRRRTEKVPPEYRGTRNKVRSDVREKTGVKQVSEKDST